MVIDEARRLAHHPRPLRVGGVAGAHRDLDVGRVEAELARDLGDLAQRALQVLGDVDGERLQRRHVDDARDAVDRLARLVREVQPVDAHEEPGERLARSGGRGDERVVARRDVRPAVALRRRRARRGSDARNHVPTAGWNPSTDMPAPKLSWCAPSGVPG